MKDISTYIIESWANEDYCVNTNKQIINWIQEKNKSIKINIRKIKFIDNNFWFYDDICGCIRNRTNSFFKITGLQKTFKNEIIQEQPIMLQNEIGYLGILCKECDGVLHFLMQAKIEPGNINKIQISPTLQATKSNFMLKHGGNKPAYLDYFINQSNYNIIVDQIQSEQSSRFYKKRNRNIIIKVDENIDVLPSHMWMTLGQIKKLMKIDNIINMDTRSVLSCIPFGKKSKSLKDFFNDKSLFYSIFNQNQVSLMPIYDYINKYKMFDNTQTHLVPLNSLKTWSFKEREFICDYIANFKIIFCEIDIEGREVEHWVQPLFEPIGQATFGLITCQENGIKKFLVHATPEIGCFDKIELGPTVQLEPSFNKFRQIDEIIEFFLGEMELANRIKFDVLLSEEGGRFYHEVNRNIIIEIEKSDIKILPEGYFWIDYKTLNLLVQINNCLNIQLRSLISLMQI